MSNKFVVWVDETNVLNNTQDSTTFASDSQRQTGFVAGTPASSLRVNTALRQANLVAAAFMNAIAPNSTNDLQSSLNDVVNEIKQHISIDLNLKNGAGLFSLVNDTSVASQRGGIALGQNNNNASSNSIIVGNGNIISGQTGAGSAIFGQNNTSNGPGSAYMFGRNLKMSNAQSTNKVLMGEYNADGGNDTYLEIGNGTSDSARSNIFEVGKNDAKFAGRHMFEKNDLNGSTSNAFYAPTTGGAKGQLLVSNGSGAPLWQSIGGVYHGTCDTAESVAVKNITLAYADNFTYTAGTAISIYFANTSAYQVSSAIFFNINGQSVPVYTYHGEALYQHGTWYWTDNARVFAVYNGAHWVIYTGLCAHMITGNIRTNTKLVTNYYPYIITVTGKETDEYGSIIVSVTDFDKGDSAQAAGEDGYWGSSVLTVTACVPANASCYIQINRMTNVRYLMQQLY